MRLMCVWNRSEERVNPIRANKPPKYINQIYSIIGPPKYIHSIIGEGPSSSYSIVLYPIKPQADAKTPYDILYAMPKSFLGRELYHLASNYQSV